MAVTSIWPIKGRVDKVINYARNPEKTRSADYKIMNPPSEIESVVNYAVNEDKTEKRMFVTGVNCIEKNVVRQFESDLARSKRPSDRVCFHGYQSFAADEVNAEEAHNIGVELAKEIWGKDFRVLVATHCNTGHYHNHFIICGASMDGEKRFHNGHEEYRRMREISDRICREHGLSVINEPKGKGKNYAEWAAEKNGQPTLRGTIRHDIDVAIRGSVNKTQFLDAMDQMGYIIDQSGKHPKIKHFGSPRFVRFDSLGEGYSVADILDRIDGNYYPEYPDIPPQEDARQIFDEEDERVSGMGYDALYRCYFKSIVITMERPEANRHLYFLMREEHKKFESYKTQSRILAENKIDTAEDLTAFREKTQSRIAELIKMRNDLRNELKRANRAGDEELAHACRYNIEIASRNLKDARAEVAACDSIFENNSTVRQKLQAIENNQFRGKENKEKDEHIRRSGRSGRKNES